MDHFDIKQLQHLVRWKQNTYNKGRNKNFTPKSKKFKSQPLKEDFDKRKLLKRRWINASIMSLIKIKQYLNSLSDIYHILLNLQLSYIKELQTNRKKFQAFEKAIVGIISIDGQTSLSNIGKILGLDIEHDIAEQKMIRNAIDSMIRYNLCDGRRVRIFYHGTGTRICLSW